MRTRSAALTDVGLRRDHNEDNFLKLDGFGLYAVADGMGGHAAGEVASRIAIETLARYRSRTSPPHDLLAAAFNRAHMAILNGMQNYPERRGMGTTMTAILTRGIRTYYAHTGDSRLYHFRGVGTRQVTKDHTLPELGPSVLASCLGSDSNAFKHLDTGLIDTVKGDLCILCSDGFADYADADMVNDLIIGSGTRKPGDLASVFVEHAMRSGGHDNITVVVVAF